MTDIASLRPALAVAIAAVAVVPILASGRRPNVREGWTVLAAASAFALVASMLPDAIAGTTRVSDLGTLVAGVELSLEADPLGLLFATVASLLWLITSFYSIGYMRGLSEHAQTRYFASFAASVAAALGVAMASNLVTLFVFYELLTVATYPLVTHDETAEARAAGRKYLAYTFGGGVAVLAGTVMIATMTGTTAFTPGGIAGLANADPVLARAAFVLLIGGFGVKAALMPLHSWLPDAMVAPTPVSGLLHAVAVVKSGVFGIARVVLDVYGVELTGTLGMGLPLAVVAAATLLLASVIALRQDNLKRRLAYSTVSQLSYIVLGIAVLDPQSIVGGLLHIPAHAFMKLTLFFTAGAIHVETHTDDISEMAGIGKRMPLTMLAFGVAAAGMAGIPLVAGFVSKWYLLIGSVSAGQTVFAVALLLSGVLNIAYFWPVFYQAFFESEDAADAKPLIEFPLGGEERSIRPGEPEPEPDAITDGGPANEVSGTSSDHLSDGGDANEVSGTSSDHLSDGGDANGAGEHHDDHDDHDHDHHGGPPADGWERRGWRGGESTWFMLGPILAAMTGAVVLGVIPRTAVFLRLIEVIVAAATGVSV